jgi:hypothetical protein
MPSNPDVEKKFQIFDTHRKIKFAEVSEPISHREANGQKVDIGTSANLNRGDLRDSINP